MKIFINYSDESFKKHQKYSLIMAKIRGGFDKTIGYTNADIDEVFYKKNIDILDNSKGGGFWLWKPYFIYKTLEEMNDGDYLFYSDSGAFFLKSVDTLIDVLHLSKQDIMGFELPLIEEQWTKKELFKALGCCGEKYRKSNQIMASYILIKKSRFSLNFFKNFLNVCMADNNITDKLQEKQYDVFIMHRHDQSIFSLLYKKENYKPFKDPSQYSFHFWEYAGMNYRKFKLGKYSNNKLHHLNSGRYFRFLNYTCEYSDIIFHSRSNNPISSFFKYQLKRILATYF